MKIQTPPAPCALASTHLIKTASGSALLKVRLIVRGRPIPDWRTYLLALGPDQAIVQALQSAGVRQAQVQLTLPLALSGDASPDDSGDR